MNEDVLAALAAYVKDPAWAPSVVLRRAAPGVAIRDILTARSQAEVDVYLDLLGWPRDERAHRRVHVGYEIISEYTWPDAPPRVVRRVRVRTPRAYHDDPGFGGPGLSSMLDPGGWRFAADLLVAEVPAPGTPVDDATAAASRRRLQRAADCLDEVTLFADGAPHVPRTAFFTRSGLVLSRLDPSRFETLRVRALASSWRRLSTQFGQLVH